MSEKITAIKLKENNFISKTQFILVLGAGTFELKSFHMAGHLTSNLNLSQVRGI